MKKGKLIVIEAGDGSGKETQTKLLGDALKAKGLSLKRISFPNYESESSVLVKMYLEGKFGTKADSVNPYAASVFYAADRYASFKTDWEKDYACGTVILADRYATSNFVHQAVKIQDKKELEEYLAWAWDFEFNKLCLPLPDIVVFLDMAPAAAAKLIDQRAKETGRKDIHEADKGYLARCHKMYREMAKRYGWITITCSDNDKPRSIETIHDEIMKKIADLIKELCND